MLDFFKSHPSGNEGIIDLQSQFVTANYIKKQRFYPYAFTEIGVAMLSSVLKFDAISTALAELQSQRFQNGSLNKRRPIGFIQPEDEADSKW